VISCHMTQQLIGNGNWCPRKNLCRDNYSCFIQIFKTLKQSRCPPIGEWIVVHQDNGVLVSTKNEWTPIVWKDVNES
jgi:hypothetical protein